MRLWHKSLISVLPREQLVSQYREDCSIMKSIAEKSTPNHILVNKVMDFPLIHFAAYHVLVMEEMRRRGYTLRRDAIERFQNNYYKMTERDFEKDGHDLLENEEEGPDYIFYKDEQNETFWHGTRYLLQCLYNLQEKYDCGGIKEDDWVKIAVFVSKLGICI